MNSLETSFKMIPQFEDYSSSSFINDSFNEHDNLNYTMITRANKSLAASQKTGARKRHANKQQAAHKMKIAKSFSQQSESQSAIFNAALGHANSHRPVNHHHQTPNEVLSRLQMMALSLSLLMFASAVSLVVGDGSHELTVTPQNLVASHTTKQQLPPEPMALVANQNDNNVIVIKYANVTKTTTGESSVTNQPIGNQEQFNQQQLNVYKLYEPLSVPVIESKFSNSIILFDVSQNQLSTLSKDLFCPLSNEVRQLNISHNLLENFDCLGLISQNGQLCLSELRVLDMSYNLIKHLPATGVATLHNLEVLNLSNNLIESLDELALSSLFKLIKLDLSANRIQQLPSRIFHKSTSIQVLRLNSNRLVTSINQAFLSGLNSLEEINLSHNNISHVSDSAFLDKINLTRVDLSHNLLANLRQEALRVTSIKQATGYRPRLHHNGQYAGVTPKQTLSQSISAEFYLSSNPFICDCEIEWMRKFQPTHAIKRTVLSPSLPTSSAAALRQSYTRIHSSDSMLNDQAHDQLSAQLSHLASSNVYQNDQPSVILAPASDSSSPSVSNNNISEIQSATNQQQQSADPSSNGQQTIGLRPMATLSATSQSSNIQHQHVTQHYARIGDLDLIKCSPLFRRNTHRNNNRYSKQHQHHDRHQASSHFQRSGQPRTQAPSDGAPHNYHNGQLTRQQGDTMIDLLGAESSNFLCHYKSHCFALCQCCDFDACDCEMICPNGCNCYYDLTWQTNIIDCSSSNHTIVPERIPMDVTGLYLDGNNFDSLKPSNLIARKQLKTLYLNSSNLQYIANRTFNGLIDLQTLYLQDNLLRSLNGHEFEPLAQLKALYLQSNRLDHISDQTFVNLRSLEILDLSNNRLTSTNLNLFWSIGHHNIRLRQLSIAHNWWSCSCSSISKFRQILRQKFLLNGSVNIVDKNQLRCYYNASTVGPLILSDGNGPSGSASSSMPMQQQQYPVYGSNQANSQQNNRQQTLLTEINQCSDTSDQDRPGIDVNPPLIHPLTEPPSNLNTQLNEYPNDSHGPSMSDLPLNPQQTGGQQTPFIEQPIYPPLIGLNGDLTPVDPFNGVNGPRIASGSNSASGSTMPLTSFILLSLLLVGIMVILVSVFMFVRQQQHRFHQSHRKKSSAASTASVSSSASSTAISSLNGKSQRHNHPALHHHTTLQNAHHHHHLIMSNGSGGATTTSIAHNLAHHHHSASSQSNIYAALVSPTSANSTQLAGPQLAQHQGVGNNGNNNIHPINNLYSSSSTTASHHSSTSQGVQNNGGYSRHQWQSAAGQQSIYNPGLYSTNGYNGLSSGENHYGINCSSQASYKTQGSLYNASGNCHDPSRDQQHHRALDYQHQGADWIRMPKVKQLMSKLVNKSLAFSGYRSSSRDELSAVTSNKIYDAFISYDKRDEPFVMQHLSAELEYGQPQYRIADRFRDLPQPSSAYIAEAISSIIGCSHRTIVVLTDSYLVNDWCRYELRAALHEASLDKSHKIIAVVLDPKCLLELDDEMRSLLTTNNSVTIQQLGGKQPGSGANQLVQLADHGLQSPGDQFLVQQQLVATLTSDQQVSTQPTAQLATGRITFINYNERKFWPKLKHLMPITRPTNQTLTLTTKN